MDLIREYQNWDPDWENSFNLLQKNNLIEKLYACLETYYPLSALFEFSLEYAILPILEFIYEIKKYKYNFKSLEKYMPAIKPSSNDENNKIAIETGKNNKTQFKIQFQDQYSHRRQGCIKYLLRMRRYSKYNYENGNFYYQFNKK